ncbi:sensor histidine kinase [Noviluteimonas dokdonensis]|nr:histidine kinase [Lysobacter dokdonensis]
MSDAHASAAPVPGPWFGWRRLRVVGIAAFVASLPMSANWLSSYWLLLLRLLMVGLAALFVFGLFERWPRRLPAWFPRWGLQVASVAAVMPVAAALTYAFTTPHDVHWWAVKSRMEGFSFIAFMGLLVGPWIAMSALYRQISGQVRTQALAFELERSRYERNALDARLRLLQAQVEPHFLFNTLANVRELVDAGSPQASSVLGSLIAYLRAAVPRLHEPGGTVAQELDLVRAYLSVMHMRMPDRLQWSVDAEAGAMLVACPPTSVLTLVENAVRHGIDPAEEGGRIDVRATVRGEECRLQVIDTGVGLSGATLDGTGLSNLRERLQLAFGDAARLTLGAVHPHGTSAELVLPARPPVP